MGKFAVIALLALLESPAAAQALDGFEVKGDKFTYKFDKDREPIQGMLVKPGGTGPFPAVVVNHGKGGNGGGFGRNPGSLFVSAGYVVIACDLTHAGKNGGDSKTFAGSKENAERILACVKVLESLPYVNPKKLCMYGNSMGAFATVGTCTQTDKIKAAAITAGGISSGGGLGGLATEQNVPKIAAPFIILHGTDDTTVRPEMAKAFKAAMDKSGKVAELKMFEGVGHGLWKDKQKEVFDLILAFFAKHLG